MSTKKPTLIKSTFLYVIFGFLPVAANFLLAPVYTRFLNPDQYALIGLATLFQTFLTFFVSLSLDVAFSRIYFQYEKKYKLKYALLSTLLLTVTIVAIGSLIVLFLIGDSLFPLLFSNPEFRFTNFGYWVVVITFCNIIFLFFAVLYRNEENTWGFVKINLLFFFIPVIGTLVGLIGYKNGALGAITGRAIASLLFIIILLILFFRKHRPVYKPAYLKIALKFSLPIIPYQLMFAGFSNLDRFMLERNFTAHDFGVYNFAVMITGVIPVFLNALQNATNPRVFRILTNGTNLEEVRKINYLSLFISTIVICICIAAVVPAMRIIINADYSDSYSYIGTLFLSFLFYLHYQIYNAPLFFYGKTKIFPVIAFSALLAGVIFNYIFIKHIGIWAVCLSLYVIRFIQWLTAYIYIYYYKYHDFIYVKHGASIWCSFIIIMVYNIILYYKIDLGLSVDAINLSPLIVLIICSFFLYKTPVYYVFQKFKSVWR